MWIWIWSGLLLGAGVLIYHHLAVVWMALILGFLFSPYPRTLFCTCMAGSLLILLKFEFTQSEALRIEGRQIDSLHLCGVSETRFGSIVQPKSEKSTDLNAYQFYAPEFLSPGECVDRLNVSFRNPSSQERSFYPPDELRRELKGPKAAIKYSGSQIENSSRENGRFLTSISEGWRRAVVEGRLSDLPREVWQRGQYLGIAHLFVVSGLHIGFLFLAVSFLVSKVFRLPSLGTSLLSASVMLVYLVSFDLGLPAWRAFSFFAVGSMLYQFLLPIRRYPSREICAFIGVLFFLGEPLSAMTPTYILSFGVSFSLISARSLTWAPVMTSLSAACLSAFLGFSSSSLSPLWNILFVPVFSFLIFPVLSLQSFLPAVESLSNFLIHQFTLLIDFCFLISKSFASFHLNSNEAGILWIGLFFVMAANSKRDQWVGIFTWLLLVVLILSIPSVSSEKNFLETIDVGQGDAYRLRLDGKNILIDGGKSLGLEKELRARSIERIDLWILTHFDDDHFAAFKDVAYRFQVNEIWIPRFDLSPHSKFLMKEFGNRVKTARDSNLRAQFGSFELVGSSFGHGRSSEEVKNKDSLIVELHAQNGLMGLFLGDALKKQERLWLKAQNKDHSNLKFLKVGHHGSETSSSVILIKSLKPRFGLISVGRGNSYRFPKLRVLDRLESVGATILRTDTHGSFIIHLDD